MTNVLQKPYKSMANGWQKDDKCMAPEYDNTTSKMTDLDPDEQLKIICGYIVDSYLEENKQYFGSQNSGTQNFGSQNVGSLTTQGLGTIIQ